MAKADQSRQLQSEAGLARRVAFERERRGWSQGHLAERMTALGSLYALDLTAVHRIERAKPPRRRITVDELVGFAKVFGLDVGELLTPPDVFAKSAANDALKRYTAARFTFERAQAAANDARQALEEVTEQVTKELNALGVTFGEVVSGTSKSGRAWLVADANPETAVMPAARPPRPKSTAKPKRSKP